MKGDEIQALADRLVTRLEQWYQRQDRGRLACLRRGLSDATRQEAWTVLGPNFGQLAIGNPVFETVAGCFAVHPVIPAPNRGNLGETMREVMGDRMTEEKEPHARFRRLLSCSDQEEICQHVRHVIRLAISRERKDDVNYRKLFEDLWWWNDRTKVEWAKAYWSVPSDTVLAGVGAPLEEETVPMPE